MEPLHPAMLPVARLIGAFGRIWHAYEVFGGENLPKDRPVLIVLYHGFLPLDGWYFAAWYHERTGRVLRELADRWMFEVPGFAWLIEHGGAVPGTREAAVRFLRQGETVLVSPGGVREALAGRRRHYRVLWGDRLGFAHVAIEAGVDLVPVFTENVHEICRSPLSDTRPFHALYERTRWPIVPVVGLGPLPFPVKLRTWIGPVVRLERGETAERLRDRTREALQALIDAHVRPAPRLPRALLARWTSAGRPRAPAT